MKHTPGPWTMDGRLVVDTRGDAVAMVNIARKVDAAHSDARLIAAAPDLLAALRELVAIDDGDVPALWGYEPFFARARAALAKAEA